MSKDGSSAAVTRIASLWDWIRASQGRKGVFLFGVVAMLVIAAGTLPTPRESLLAQGERIAFDVQMRLLRAVHPRPLADDIVLLGIDEETEARFREPLALWHRHFARVLHALAKAQPRAVGVDVVLPERSFDAIMPGLDLAMMRGMLDLKRSAPLVYVQTADSHGRIVPVQPNYRSIVTPDNLGIDQQLRDPDNVSRYFWTMRDLQGEVVPTLVSQLLRAVGRDAPEGFIDYSLGVPLEYIPVHAVEEMDEEALRKTSGGRVVLLGTLMGGTDRWRLPVKLLARDPGRQAADVADAAARLDYNQPGVLVHPIFLERHHPRRHPGKGRIRDPAGRGHGSRGSRPCPRQDLPGAGAARHAPSGPGRRPGGPGGLERPRPRTPRPARACRLRTLGRAQQGSDER